MEKFAIDSEIGNFIDRYLAVSGLSTATTVEQQRIDYAAVVQCFRQPRPDSISSRDEMIEGRHGPIPVRRYSQS